ncbi:YaiO family outer membrane beta-barrel protein [Sphingomonas astaxanthinifaciens]|uniref:YaiO family OMP domain-containing protein n=1 Tax=Sphingomonas astaxanthinifaciens DSM 22298 TaxID=1123267 RepID=A0ABQ5ZDJ2_9SPHN|nr:YaiO family outer membrane beta-barrel protein [Sphingomonas astaxanthinifaciens]GLR48682.1 hypothetical protein GCM10007925_24010 [Sphingomonas astaxanthinifaciens DSM 22298]
MTPFLVFAGMASVALVPAQPSDYEAAVAARRAGQPAEAAERLERWLAAHPDDVDARLQYGLALIDLGRPRDAERALRQVLAAAPGYEDARLGLARIDRDRPPRWRFDLDGGASQLSGRQPDWRELAGQLRYQDGESAYGLRVEASRRFGRSDVYAEVAAERSLAPGFAVSLIAGATPDADFRPVWQLGAGARWRVRATPAPTLLTLDTRVAHYRSGTVALAKPGIEQYVAGGRLWGTAQLIVLRGDGRTQIGALGRIDAEVSDGLRLFAGAANAPDLSEGVPLRDRSLFGGVEASLGDRRFLRFSIARHDLPAGADRTDFSVGGGIRF